MSNESFLKRKRGIEETVDKMKYLHSEMEAIGEIKAKKE
jgi:hypothetical protein